MIKDLDPRSGKNGTGHVAASTEALVSSSEQVGKETPPGWIGPRLKYPQACVYQLFEQQVERRPDALAAVFNERQLTYGELNHRANQLARYLRSRGVGPEVLAGICLQPSVEMLIALLGVWKAGGAYVPLDPNYPNQRLLFMLNDAAARVLLTDDKSSAALGSVACETIRMDSDWTVIAEESGHNLIPSAAPANLAYVMYTSGSTGQPKGVMVLHSGLVNYLLWAIQAYGIGAGSSAPVHGSISFDLTVTSLYAPLLAGGWVELLADFGGGEHLLAALKRRKYTLVKITPAHLELLQAQFRPERAAEIADIFVIGGENLPAESLRFWRRFAPATRLINEYGPTETVVGCCAYEVQATDSESGFVPIGRPIDNVQLYLLDSRFQPVPSGSPGEVYIGGAGVGRGYLNRPELTPQRFVPDPFSNDPAARLYKSGDLALCQRDGNLRFIGRLDDQVKIRGQRIELGEVEHALAGHDGVRLCLVVAREVAEQGKELVAYVVPHAGQATLIGGLPDFLKQHLPDSMIPARFVFLDHFPLTQNGKIDRHALPDPDQSSVPVGGPFVAPRTRVETELAGIWAKLLNMDQISVGDDLFDLGAHSLMVMRAVMQIREIFQVDLHLRHIFEAPTVAALAQTIDALSWSCEEPSGDRSGREEIAL